MGRNRRAFVAVGVSAVLAFGLGVSGPAQAVEPADSTLTVSGQLLVVTDFGADLAGDSQIGEPEPVLTYSVVTDDGQLIAIDGMVVASAQTGDRFEGTVTIPDDVASDLSVAPGTVVDGDSGLGADVVDAANAIEAPLVVDQSYVVDAAVQPSATPGAHTMDVAVVSGAISGDVAAQVAALTSQVGAYWADETDGGISSFTQPSAAQILANSGCPATNTAYNTVWASAALAFGRTASDYTNGNGRHLVVILPAACNDTTGTGLGTIGSSLHQGGLNFISNYLDIAPTTIAHEIGHNLGLGHGNLSYCGTLAYDEGAGCTTYEYNDVYNVMGYALVDYGASLPALPASQRDYLKGLQASELAVQAPTSGAPLSKVTYTLKPASDSSGLRGIKVTDPFTGLIYYVELRSGTGSDSGAFYTHGYTWNLNGGGADVIGTDTGVRVLQLDTSTLEQKGAMSKVFAVVTNPAAPTFAFSALHPPEGGRPAEDFNSRSGGLRIVVDAMTPNTTTPTSATVTITTGGWTGTNAPPAVARISGADRFATSAEVAKKYSSASVVYVANGSNYPDALSAAPAAAYLDAPLLLTGKDTLPAAITAEITRLHPNKIVIVGGTAVVSNTVKVALDSIYGDDEVIRIPGANRYETSRNITDDAFFDVSAPTTTAFIATGLNFPDALSASAAADKFAAPVILVNGLANSADAATLALLNKLQVTEVYVVGGTGVISTNLMNSLAAFNPTRLAGTDRYSTSVAINTLFAPGPVTNVYIANGTGFADALSGAALAGKNNAPLYIVPGTCVPPNVLTQMDGLAPSNAWLLGGTAVLSTAVSNLQRC